MSSIFQVGEVKDVTAFNIKPILEKDVTTNTSEPLTHTHTHTHTHTLLCVPETWQYAADSSAGWL